MNKNGYRIKMWESKFNQNFNKMIDIHVVFGYVTVGAPRGITVAWGLTIPNSGPAWQR